MHLLIRLTILYCLFNVVFCFAIIVSVFGKAIHSLSRIGEEIYIEALDHGVSISSTTSGLISIFLFISMSYVVMAMFTTCLVFSGFLLGFVRHASEWLWHCSFKLRVKRSMTP